MCHKCKMWGFYAGADALHEVPAKVIFQVDEDVEQNAFAFRSPFMYVL